MRLELPTWSEQRFTLSDGEYVAEASDFGCPFMARVYDDAGDLGFEFLTSSGSKVLCYLTHVKVNAENEMRACEFSSLSGITVIIFND